ncbi:MAG: phosphatase PAP2 family protein [Candidatus Phytoplasma sp.]|nr:phosphatase PAP2 family protein [Phytoplasma sp.]
MELEIIRSIQSISNQFLDTVFKMITFLGDQYVFIGLAVVIYWFIDKKKGFKLVFVFLLSTAFTSVFKTIIKRPRPFIEDSTLSIGTKTHGYSFPSGHSQAITVETSFLYDEYGKKKSWVKYGLLSLLILVPFSRVYLGQHYPTDVIAGVILGIVMFILGSYLFKQMKDKEDLFGLGLGLIFLIILIILSFLKLDYDKYKDLFVGCAGFIGFSIGYFLEKNYVKFDVKNQSIKKTIITLVIGLTGIILIQFGLKELFPKGHLVLDGVRYLLLGLYATVGTLFICSKVVKHSDR